MFYKNLYKKRREQGIIQPMAKMLGDFTTKDDWNNAIRIERAQIKYISTNKYFRKLNTLYFKKFSKQTWDILDNDKYYKEEIAENFCLLKPNIFFTNHYKIPKYPGHTFREYTFFSLPMKLLYNTLVLYLLRLSTPLINLQNQNKRIESFYGGKLAFKKKTEALNLSQNNLYHKNHYKKFKDNIYKTIEREDFNSVIKFDLKDFFSSINIPDLLNNLQENITNSQRKKLSFDEDTISEIQNIFTLINPHGGIPLGDNLIASAVLANIYLTIVDGELEEILNHKTEIVDYKFVRYTDDYYLFFNIPSKIYDISSTLLSQITETLDRKFSLSINNKTAIFDLNTKDDLQELRDTIRKVSVENFYDPEQEEDLTTTIELLLATLQSLNSLEGNKEGLKALALEKDIGEGMELEVLKSLYDENIRTEITTNNLYRETFNELAENFNYSLTSIDPTPLTIFYSLFPKAKQEYRKYLQGLNVNSTNNFDLIKNYVIQDDLGDESLLKYLLTSENLETTARKELRILLRNSPVNLNFSNTGYFNLDKDRFKKLVKQSQVKDEIVYQGTLRRVAEINRRYDVAINHLLNEFLGICFSSDTEKSETSNLDDYYRKDHIKLSFTQKEQVSLGQLFDTRNHNRVSHNYSDHSPTAPDQYKDSVKKVVTLITSIK